MDRQPEKDHVVLHNRPVVNHPYLESGIADRRECRSVSPGFELINTILMQCGADALSARPRLCCARRKWREPLSRRVETWSRTFRAASARIRKPEDLDRFGVRRDSGQGNLIGGTYAYATL
jgi:hypothetical protein